MGKFEELAELLRSPDEEKRRLCVVEMAKHPLPEAKSSIFYAMGDGSWRVRKEAVDVLLSMALGESEMEELVGLLRSHDNAGLRNSAVETLERLGSRALPVLSRYVGDEDHDVRKFVIDILGNIGDARTCPLLIAALDDADHNVSAAAAENLGKIGDPVALTPLINALARNDIWFRYSILEALSKIGKPVPMEVIAPLAGDKLLKKAVFDCLGAIGDAAAAAFLLEGLTEKVKSVRDASALAVMKIRDRLATRHAEHSLEVRLRELAGSPFIEGILESFDSPDRSLQEAIVRLLGIIGDERATKLLLEGCRDDRLRTHCLQAFRNMGVSCTTSLVSAFPTAGEEERCIIAFLCGELRLRDGVLLLDEGMRDHNPTLRRISAQAAGKIGLTGLLSSIAQLLEDGEPEVREGAVESLSCLAPLESAEVSKIAVGLAAAESAEKRRDAALLFTVLADIEKLFLLMKDADPQVRKTAVQSLGVLKSPSSIGNLVMALVDEESDVRIAAADALGDIGGAEVIDPLLLTMKDEDPWVACAAMKSLARLGSDRALPAIEEVMAGADGLVMITALETLAEIGGERAFEAVQKALGASDEEVVKSAVGILSRNGDDWLEKHGESLLRHPHWDVRNVTARVLAEKWGERAIPLLRAAYDSETDELVRVMISDILDRFR